MTANSRLLRFAFVSLCCFCILRFQQRPLSVSAEGDGNSGVAVEEQGGGGGSSDDVAAACAAEDASCESSETDDASFDSALENKRRLAGNTLKGLLDDDDDDDDESKSWTSKNFVPVILIPSLAGTRLRTWSPLNCGALSQFHVGGTVWLDLKRMILQTKCWMKCLKLKEGGGTGDADDDEGDDGCMTRPDEGVDAVSQVDETVPVGGFLLKATLHMLASMGYEPDRSMYAHPYDWRLPPGKMEDRDAAFSNLRRKIEGAVEDHRRRNPENPTRGVMLAGLSLGNLFIQYFFEYMKVELGERGLERWTDEYVHGLFLGGAPFLGAAGPVKSLLVGETMGMPWKTEQSRELYRTWGVFPWMFPHNHPEASDRRHAAMNHGETDHPTTLLEIELLNGTTVRPESTADIVRKGGFFGRVGGEDLEELQRTIDRWYADDPVIGGGSPLRPFVPPKGIDRVICAYGVNVPTEVGFKFREKRTENENDKYEISDVLMNQRGDIHDADGEQVLPQHRRFAARKSGDGAVPYFSLSWCHSWFGESPVNITRVPAHVDYEEEDVEKFENVDLLDKDVIPVVGYHTSHGYNTFFEKRWTEDHPDTGLQHLKSIQVWELDGIIHKDTLTDPRVMHLMRSMITKGEKFQQRLVRMKRKMIRKAREEIDKSGVLEQDWIEETAMEGAQFGRDDFPTSDKDCTWDYYNVECAWPRYCAYSYRLGDISLSQSCRLRDAPLAKDDPLLLQRHRDILNETLHNVTSEDGRIQWRVVYRDKDRGWLPPFVRVTLAFLCGIATLGAALYAVLRFHSDSVKKALGARSQQEEMDLMKSVELLNQAVAQLQDDVNRRSTLDGKVDKKRSPHEKIAFVRR